MMSELLSADEVAKRLRVKPTTVLHWTRSGRIPAIRVSRKIIRFDFDAILAVLGGRTKEPY